MDKQQANSGNDETSRQGDSDQMLPPVQVQDDGAASDPASAADPSDADADQIIPASRALVTTPEEAADSDLIEKEWVLKAKQIVEHTAEDPYVQQQELSKMKSDYMKKRYNKDIGSA